VVEDVALALMVHRMTRAVFDLAAVPSSLRFVAKLARTVSWRELWLMVHCELEGIEGL
jgi:hypothetical protein